MLLFLDSDEDQNGDEEVGEDDEKQTTIQCEERRKINGGSLQLTKRTLNVCDPASRKTRAFIIKDTTGTSGSSTFRHLFRFITVII